MQFDCDPDMVSPSNDCSIEAKSIQYNEENRRGVYLTDWRAYWIGQRRTLAKCSALLYLPNVAQLGPCLGILPSLPIRKKASDGTKTTAI